MTVIEDIVVSKERQYDNGNLPNVGHFIIDAFVRVVKGSSGVHDNTGSTKIEVSLDIYSHTKHGSSLVDKIRTPMPGEIGRVNRKWRRLKKNTVNQSAL